MTRIKIYREDYIPTPLEELWARFSAHHFALGGLWFLGILVLLILTSPLLISHPPDLQNISVMLTPPFWSEGGQIEYLLGTDDLGRDLFSRMILGASLTVGYAVLIVFFSMMMGTALGSILAMIKGFKGNIIGQLLDTLLSIPSLLMAILIVAIIGPSQQAVFLPLVLPRSPNLSISFITM